MIPTNFFISFSSSSQVAFCMMFHVKSAVITVQESITEFTHVMDVLVFLNVPFVVIVNMSANQNPMDSAWSTRHTAINAVHVVLKNVLRLG